MNETKDEDLIRNIFVRQNEGKIELNEVIDKLEEKGFLFKDSTISFFSNSEKMYISAGKYPLGSKVQISMEDSQDKRLIVKYQLTSHSPYVKNGSPSMSQISDLKSDFSASLPPTPTISNFIDGT